jgi:hypothetical protein
MLLARRSLLKGASASLMVPGMAEAHLSRPSGAAYQPLTAGIVLFLNYGQSLDSGWWGNPPLSVTQPFDNVMIGNASRAAQNSSAFPPTNTWVPLGNPQSNGIYPFNPLIATDEDPNVGKNGQTAGESPGVSALNYLRGRYLQKLGVPSNPACRFALADCGIGGMSIQRLSKGDPSGIYNRLLMAAQYMQQTAFSLGLTFQIGGMFWVQGERDVSLHTSQAQYQALLLQLIADVNADVVCGIAGAPAGTTIPWVSHQADSTTQTVVEVYNAEMALATTPGSDFYVGSPAYCCVDHNIHLTANGYRQLGSHLGRAMAEVPAAGGQRMATLADVFRRCQWPNHYSQLCQCGWALAGWYLLRHGG